LISEEGWDGSTDVARIWGEWSERDLEANGIDYKKCFNELKSWVRFRYYGKEFLGCHASPLHTLDHYIRPDEESIKKILQREVEVYYPNAADQLKEQLARDIYFNRMDNLFERMRGFAVIGHNHRAGIREESGDFIPYLPNEKNLTSPVSVGKYMIEDEKVLVSVGPVSRPRNEEYIGTASYVILRGLEVEFRRVPVKNG